MHRPEGLLPAELGFFAAVAGAASLSAAARDLGVSTAAVSKRLAQMEARLGVPLLVRTTRRATLTAEGALLHEHARRILAEIDGLRHLLGAAAERPAGLLRVNATLGFGRTYVAPLIAQYTKRYPEVDVQLQLSADPPPLAEDAFDVCVRFGAPPEARIVGKFLAPNRRLLCAAPRYLRAHGEPATPAELARHNCIGIRQGSDAYGVWRLTPQRGSRAESVHVRGNLTTNDGEIAVSWALDGLGIVMRAEWDIARYLESGRLVQVLPGYSTPEADIYAVFHRRHQALPRVRTFVDFLVERFAALGR